jgi:hypothetical protein
MMAEAGMIATTPTTLRADPQLRELLLTYFLNSLTGAELADWLKDIGQDSRGSVEERRVRIRVHTRYLTMPQAEFPGQTEAYLQPYSIGHLADLCEQLSIPANGSRPWCCPRRRASRCCRCASRRGSSRRRRTAGRWFRPRSS